MSESAGVSEATETNGDGGQPSFNGEADEHLQKSPGSAEDKTTERIGPDSVSENASKKSTPGSGNRSKKRKKAPRDATAPKQPLTGYFRFLNDRREKVRAENPNMSFAELTKLLASEWSSLPAEQKQLYLDAAEQDKERYNKEFSDYKQTEAYKLFTERQSTEGKKERNGTAENNEPVEPPVTEKDTDFSGFDIPIFTEEFLDHNKACESELRQLRKATSDYEAQNAVLQRHVDSLHAAVNRLESETNQQRTTNQSLQRHLDALRGQLAGCFATVPLPGTNEGATPQNIDNYVEKLETLLNGNAEPSLRNALRSAVSRLELLG
ncbi:high mobility group protein 20A [Fopius arisanus]|uniref:High mobility group protein 20A n=1 Tax=Fopius arisanus TaxID=64838 RepID=A0A9R1T226_9HYME|nr:PREDICTED: high mobility group protein 20A [Fopius arisanus]